MNLPQHIFGMHDAGAEPLFAEAGKQGWIVVSALATDAPGDFSALANRGHAVVVRLNHGYHPQGTLPRSTQYDAFAQACANYVSRSRGVNLWIIGNETNLSAERPQADGPAEVITPALYARCFKKCRDAIKNAAGHADDWVIPSPPGPWNAESGEWVGYFRDLLTECINAGAPPDAIALHTYSHEARMDAALVESEERMTNPGLTDRHWQFRAYRDFMAVVPQKLNTLPVLITESQHLPWENRNAGWIQKAYAEIDAWNAVATNQPIQALCLFRWQANPHDETQAGWSLSDRRNLQDDFRAALQNNYAARWTSIMKKKQSGAGKPAKPKPDPSLLPLDKVRWFVEETLRKLEAADTDAAHDLLVNTINPWFYKSYPEHAADLTKAQAHTDARWHAEQATRELEAKHATAAHRILLQNVLPWLLSTGPHELGILGVAAKRGKVKAALKAKRGTKKTAVKKTRTRLPAFGVLGVSEVPSTVVTTPSPLRDTLAREADARQLLPFNRDAALQKHIFGNGLVPNSAEFSVKVENVAYVAQRAEHLLTGQVRVYYAPAANFAEVRFVTRDAGPGLNTPFKGGNRITQLFGARPEYYQQFKLAGHEGVDMVPLDGDRDMYCIEDGVILRDIDIPGDAKTNAYGIYIAVYNAANRRLWYYCHMLENRVQAKQQVKRGELLGRMGGTGNVQGDHLHLNLKLLDGSGLPLTPSNGYKGWSDPLPLLKTLNAAETTTPLRDALLQQADSNQSIAFNTRAALQKRIFADGLLPNSAEFNIQVDAVTYVAQRAENVNTGAVRVYYAPTTNFTDIHFVDR